LCLFPENLKKSVSCDNLLATITTEERMLQRGLSRQMVKDTWIAGDVIEDYPDDEPFPRALFLGWHVSVPFF